MVTNLFQYWAHRFFHSHEYLWRFHSVHHSTRATDWLAGLRTHVVNTFVVRAVSFMPFYGFSSVVFNTCVNTSINFGFLKYLFVTPQYHHWYHCDDPAHYGKHFSVHFPFLGKRFSNYCLSGNV